MTGILGVIRIKKPYVQGHYKRKDGSIGEAKGRRYTMPKAVMDATGAKEGDFFLIFRDDDGTIRLELRKGAQGSLRRRKGQVGRGSE